MSPINNQRLLNGLPSIGSLSIGRTIVPIRRWPIRNADARSEIHLVGSNSAAEGSISTGRIQSRVIAAMVSTLQRRLTLPASDRTRPIPQLVLAFQRSTAIRCLANNSPAQERPSGPSKPRMSSRWCKITFKTQLRINLGDEADVETTCRPNRGCVPRVLSAEYCLKQT